jgi:hypothetical protein
MLMTAPTAAVRSRRLMRVSNRAAQRSKKVPKGPSFRHFSTGKQTKDRQPGDNCAERLFHNHAGYCFDSFTLNRISRSPCAALLGFDYHRCPDVSGGIKLARFPIRHPNASM